MGIISDLIEWPEVQTEASKASEATSPEAAGSQRSSTPIITSFLKGLSTNLVSNFNDSNSMINTITQNHSNIASFSLLDLSTIIENSSVTTTTTTNNSKSNYDLSNQESFINNLTALDQEPDEPAYMEHLKFMIVILHLSVFVTGLIGNFLVCLSVYRNKSLQTVTNYYIVNLAIADFLVILICLPPTVYWDLSLTWDFGLVLCKLVLYLQSISVSVSVLTLTCISIDRWFAICRPLEFCSTKRRAKITIIMIWFASMIFCSPDVIFLTTNQLHEEDGYIYTDCFHSWPTRMQTIYQLCIVIFLFICPFLFMSISYIQIVEVLWRDETIIDSLTNSMVQVEEEQQLIKQRQLALQIEASRVANSEQQLPTILETIGTSGSGLGNNSERTNSKPQTISEQIDTAPPEAGSEAIQANALEGRGLFASKRRLRKINWKVDLSGGKFVLLARHRKSGNKRHCQQNTSIDIQASGQLDKKEAAETNLIYSSGQPNKLAAPDLSEATSGRKPLQVGEESEFLEGQENLVFGLEQGNISVDKISIDKLDLRGQMAEMSQRRRGPEIGSSSSRSAAAANTGAGVSQIANSQGQSNRGEKFVSPSDPINGQSENYSVNNLVARNVSSKRKPADRRKQWQLFAWRKGANGHGISYANNRHHNHNRQQQALRDKESSTTTTSAAIPMSSPTPNQTGQTESRFCKLVESRKKAAKMLIVIVIMFGLCYLPIHLINTLRYTIGLPQNDITTIASLVSHWLCYFNSAVNPLIYNLMSGKFRREFANFFCCKWFRRSSAAPTTQSQAITTATQSNQTNRNMKQMNGFT